MVYLGRRGNSFRNVRRRAGFECDQLFETVRARVGGVDSFALAAHGIDSDLRWINNRVVLNNYPLLGPYIYATNEPAGDFLVGGLFPNNVRGQPMPLDLVHEVMRSPKLVYFGWELSRERLATWRALAQVFLMFSKRPMPDLRAPVQQWLLALAPKLKKCGTEITLTGPNELTMVRNATIGLSGAELTWLGVIGSMPRNFP